MHDAASYAFWPEVMLPWWFVTDEHLFVRGLHAPLAAFVRDRLSSRGLELDQMLIPGAEHQLYAGSEILVAQPASPGTLGPQPEQPMSIWDLLLPTDSHPYVDDLMKAHCFYQTQVVAFQAFLDEWNRYFAHAPAPGLLDRFVALLDRPLFDNHPDVRCYVHPPVGTRPEHLSVGVRIAPPQGLPSSIRDMPRVDIVTAWRVRFEWSENRLVRVTSQGIQPAIHDATPRYEALNHLRHAENFLLSAGTLYHKFGRQEFAMKSRLEWLTQFFDRYANTPEVANGLVDTLADFGFGDVPPDDAVARARHDIASVHGLIRDQAQFIKFMRTLRGYVLLRSPDPQRRATGEVMLRASETSRDEDRLTIVDEKSLRDLYAETIALIEQFQLADIEALYARQGAQIPPSANPRLPKVLHEPHIVLQSDQGSWRPITVCNASALRYVLYEYIWNACKRSSLSRPFRVQLQVRSPRSASEDAVLEFSIYNDVRVQEYQPEPQSGEGEGSAAPEAAATLEEQVRRRLLRDIQNAYDLLSATGEGGFGLFMVRFFLELAYGTGVCLEPQDSVAAWRLDKPFVRFGFVLPRGRTSWDFSEVRMKPCQASP